MQFPQHGQGLGYETTAFNETAPDGTQRIAAFVFWRGGGMAPMNSSGMGAIGISMPARRSVLTLPLRILAGVTVLPIAWIADQIIATWKRRSRNQPSTSRCLSR